MKSSTFNEARVREVMRLMGCDYRAACRWLGSRGGQRAAAKRRNLPDVRTSWAWKKDFA